MGEKDMGFLGKDYVFVIGSGLFVLCWLTVYSTNNNLNLKTVWGSVWAF